MCLFSSKLRNKNFLEKNKGKTWIYVWKLVNRKHIFDDKIEPKLKLISPFKHTDIKIGVNKACDHYTPNFEYSNAVEHGSHVFLYEKDAKNYAKIKWLKTVRCKVYLKDFIAAGVWTINEQKKSSYQAVFSKIFIPKSEYLKALENQYVFVY